MSELGFFGAGVFFFAALANAAAPPAATISAIAVEPRFFNPALGQVATIRFTLGARARVAVSIPRPRSFRRAPAAAARTGRGSDQGSRQPGRGRRAAERGQAMRKLIQAVALCSWALMASSARATNVGSDIAANTEWTVAGSPYVVTAPVSVYGGVTLTVDPGVTVQFVANSGLTVAGTLSAAGTSSSPIVFTSSAGTAAGSWRTITFTGGTSSSLSYATVSYGGADGGFRSGAIVVGAGSATFDHLTVSASGNAGIVVKNNGASLTLSNSTVTGSASYGLLLFNHGSASVSSTGFTGNGDYAISSDAGCPLTGMTGVTASANASGKDGVEFRGNPIADTETWLPGLDWFVTASPTVTASGNLTIGAGATVRFLPSTGLTVAGTLTAAGTSSSPIVLTSSSGAAAGSWRTLTFTGGTSNRLSYATVSYAGSDGGFGSGAINVAGGSASFDHLTVMSEERKLNAYHTAVGWSQRDLRPSRSSRLGAS